jgi:DNA-binding beta-propeller fold protein YncE
MKNKLAIVPVVVVALTVVATLFFDSSSKAKRDISVSQETKTTESIGSNNGHVFKVLKTYAIGGIGEWGYLTLDSQARRLYLPRTNDLQIMDLDTGSLVSTMKNVSTQVNHGVGLVAGQNLGFDTAGKDNDVALFDPTTLQVKSRINIAGNPNAIIYDPASKHIVINDHQDVTIIDPAHTKAAPITIPSGGSMEFLVADGKGNVYASLESTNEVIRVNTNTNAITARWPVAPAATPSGITYDAKNNRLLVSAHAWANASTTGGALVVLDATSGKVLSTVPIGNGASGVAYDPATGVIVTANGKDGTATVVKETSPGMYRAVQTLNTILGARHVVFDPKTSLFYLEGDLSGQNIYTAGEQFGVMVVGTAN